LPSTSQPSAALFKDCLNELLNQGKDVIPILISSVISSTVNSALQAQKEIASDRISVVDSKTASLETTLHSMVYRKNSPGNFSSKHYRNLSFRNVLYLS
jgi:fatty acid-binding protein DegV